MFDFKINSQLLDYLKSLLLSKKTTKIRFAFAYYISLTNGQYFFEINQFKHNNSYKSAYFNNSAKLKSEILNLDWESKSHKLVINVVKETIFEKFLSFVSPESMLESICSSQDETGKMLKYNNIHFCKFDVKNKEIDRSTIEQIFSENFMLQRTSGFCQLEFLKDLYFLKRNLFLNVDEYKNSRKEKVYSNKIENLKYHSAYEKALLEFKVKSFRKENFELFSGVVSNSSKTVSLKFNNDVVEVVRNLYLISAKLYEKYNHYYITKGDIWIEILDNESSFNRILDIHLTAGCLVECFKEHLKVIRFNRFKIEIVKIKQLIDNNEKWITSAYTNEDLSHSEFKSLREYEAMECFSHFTYQKSNRYLIVIDLRTLKSKSVYLITEPVIFSKIPDSNRFSSSDLGPNGIDNFKNNHKCNDYCREIGLRSLKE